MPETAEGKITVLIVDDHTIVRQGLRSLLELMEDIEIAGEAANGETALTLVQSLRPAVVLMDLVMPGMDGIAATQRICQLGFNTRVIALTSFLEDEKIIPAIQAGAAGFLLKDLSPQELVDAIRACARGEARLHPNATRLLMERLSAPPSAAAPAVEELTAREVDVLRAIGQGLNNREIAAQLVIGEGTVKTHVSSLLGKLGLNDRTQLAIYAIKKGYVTGA
jgi:DNA-binding NarL/FixJ family response regulator